MNFDSHVDFGPQKQGLRASVCRCPVSGADLVPGKDLENIIYMMLCMDEGTSHSLQVCFLVIGRPCTLVDLGLLLFVSLGSQLAPCLHAGLGSASVLPIYSFLLLFLPFLSPINLHKKCSAST